MKLSIITTLSEIYARNYWRKKHAPAGEKGLEPRNLNYYRAYGTYQTLTARLQTIGMGQEIFGGLGQARYIPILPCNLQRFWGRFQVSAPGCTLDLTLYRWNGGADEVVGVIDQTGLQPNGFYFFECDVSAMPNRDIDPLINQGFFMISNTLNAMTLEAGIDFMLTERRLIP